MYELLRFSLLFRLNSYVYVSIYIHIYDIYICSYISGCHKQFFANFIVSFSCDLFFVLVITNFQIYLGEFYLFILNVSCIIEGKSKY